MRTAPARGPRALLLTLLIGGCAMQSPGRTEEPAVNSTPSSLSCTLPTSCVDSLGSGGMAPLTFRGSPEQAMADLRVTLATYPQAEIVRSGSDRLVAIFTTAAGFRDEVEFRIDPQARRIDFRSRSPFFALFDFGKNRSRMREFSLRFGQASGS
ncbi:MAG: DUF1499 domain-containing protein [Lautropia sp.]